MSAYRNGRSHVVLILDLAAWTNYLINLLFALFALFFEISVPFSLWERGMYLYKEERVALRLACGYKIINDGRFERLLTEN